VRDVSEGGDGIAEEHRSKAADGDVETLRREAVILHVCVDERNVMGPYYFGELPRTVYHLGGVIDPNRASIGCLSRGLTCGLTRATPDVDHVIVPTQRVSAAQGLVEHSQLRVVVHRAMTAVASAFEISHRKLRASPERTSLGRTFSNHIPHLG
jgi:hypothetical protein